MKRGTASANTNSAQCTVQKNSTEHSAQCTVHSTQNSVHSAQYTVHSTQCTVHSTVHEQCTVHKQCTASANTNSAAFLIYLLTMAGDPTLTYLILLLSFALIL